METTPMIWGYLIIIVNVEGRKANSGAERGGTK